MQGKIGVWQWRRLKITSGVVCTHGCKYGEGISDVEDGMVNGGRMKVDHTDVELRVGQVELSFGREAGVAALIVDVSDLGTVPL